MVWNELELCGFLLADDGRWIARDGTIVVADGDEHEIITVDGLHERVNTRSGDVSYRRKAPYYRRWRRWEPRTVIGRRIVWASAVSRHMAGR